LEATSAGTVTPAFACQAGINVLIVGTGMAGRSTTQKDKKI
jgi:hypothetical protein